MKSPRVRYSYLKLLYLQRCWTMYIQRLINWCLTFYLWKTYVEQALWNVFSKPPIHVNWVCDQFLLCEYIYKIMGRPWMGYHFQKKKFLRWLCLWRKVLKCVMWTRAISPLKERERKREFQKLCPQSDKTSQLACEDSNICFGSCACRS